MLNTAALMLAVCAGQIAGADERADAPDDPDAWIGEHLLTAAGEYTVAVQQDEEWADLMLEEPLLRFYDPLTNVPAGYLLVWTRDSRPEACATFWVHRLPSGLRELHEFQSLSRQPIRARRDDADIWLTDAAGVEWQVLTAAPPPAPTKGLRLAQMRQQARRFSAATHDGEGRRELRLLPQPAYRYECPDEEVSDGAIFVFAKGTNPELLVLFETREIDDGYAWHVATARMTIRRLEILLDDEELESKPALGGRLPNRDPRQPYYVFRRPLGAPETMP